ncbi:MAG: SRPBCC family protein [Ferruginibacter sp.]
MKKLYKEQLLPISIKDAWDFFTSPQNLNAITPPDLIFNITSEMPEKIYAGLFITYRLKPLLNIPVNWCTEITHVEEYRYFVDEQRFGPYKCWHHEHHFEERNGKTFMVDIVYYDTGKWIFGALAEKFFITQKLNDIFDYRFNKLNEIFHE